MTTGMSLRRDILRDFIRWLLSDETLDLQRSAHSRHIDGMGHSLADLMVPSPWIRGTWFEGTQCACHLRVPGCLQEVMPDARPGWGSRASTDSQFHLPLHCIRWRWWAWEGGLSSNVRGWERASLGTWSLKWAALYMVIFWYKQMLKQPGLGWKLSFHVPLPRDLEYLRERHCAKVSGE